MGAIAAIVATVIVVIATAYAVMRRHAGAAAPQPTTTFSYGRKRGTVKSFDPVKGYGMIQPDDGSEDVYLHISAVEHAGLPKVLAGQYVEYALVENGGKEMAEDLTFPRRSADKPKQSDPGCGCNK